MTSGHHPTVLVIEDQDVVACDLRRFLDDTGYHVVGPIGSSAEALDTIANSELDGVVLDVKLLGGASAEIADALKAARIPHIFINGWAIGQIPEQCRDHFLLNNPYDYRALLDALKRAIEGRSAS